jgi:uncharacterized DUF497 family protein
MGFEFDPEKDDANRGKHGVSLSLARASSTTPITF